MTKALLAGAVLAWATAALAGEVRHLGRGLVHDGDALVIDDPAGKVAVDVAGWQPLPNPPEALVVLRRYDATGGELRILDRRGRPLGTVALPQGWTGFATATGVVLVQESLHEPGRPHWLKFLTHAGDVLTEVGEELTLVDWTLAPGGGLATVSRAPGDGTGWVILAYDGRGAELWRHHATGTTPPTALLTAGGQLVVLEHDLDAGISTVTILVQGRGPKRFRIWTASRMVADPDSSRVAAVGRENVVLFDARTRKLVWRRDERIDFVLWGGLRFDRRGGRLLAVTAERDPQGGKARLGLRSYRPSDGAEERQALGDAPADALPTVVDVDTPPEGGRRVLLHDRAVIATPEGAQP